MKLYKQGARKEYYLVEQLRKQGYDIVFRSAGSHSPIDIVAISTKDKTIKLIQSKRTLSKSMSYINSDMREQLLSDYSYINGNYIVVFDVM